MTVGPEVVVIPLSGELDISNLEMIETLVESAIAGGATHLVFDLSEVTFLDSSSLALFSRTALRTSGVTLRRPSPLMARLIEATGLASVLAVEP